MKCTIFTVLIVVTRVYLVYETMAGFTESSTARNSGVVIVE
jgi:hypothetical protein